MVSFENWMSQKIKLIGEISNGVFLKKSQISFGENGDENF